MRFQVPNEVSHVTHTLSGAGFEAYLVGGCVRDLLLGKEPKDWDVTTNAHPEATQALFEDTYYNNDFGTVGVVSPETQDERVKVVEVTPYRTEHGYSDARRPDRVEFSERLEDDLSRRDFTVNALAYDVLKDIVIDCYNGQKDLSERRLIAVGDAGVRFQEDALRMLRAVRLSAELGFTISQETYEALAQNRENLARISKERIRDEFTRMVMSPAPAEALFHLKQLGLLSYVVPDLERAVDVPQNRSHIYTVFEHLLRSLQHAADKGYPLEIRLAALFHDISKPETRRFSREINDHTFFGHEVVGSRVTRRALAALKYPKDVIEKVSLLVRWHMFFSDPDEISLSAVRRMIANVGEENIWDLVNLRICDRIGSGKPKEEPVRLRKYKAMIDEALRAPVSVGMLKIDGNTLISEFQMKPGPRIGWILHALLEEVLDDPTRNSENYLKSRVEELATLSDEELRRLGEQGKDRREREDEAMVTEIKKHHKVNF
ncbi:HD domain-containing protein [Patescibacteria group bacterium]|jgi:poly(A) polymerase/tRNA nucleotidyltransferase (CCA-adding enzyme)|nr:HD domain-containing protein [Patescibacteria group bacterium]